ncbi:type VI secretion system membrane subunit TssM [Glaciimonas immobilis]|uniref:Type VI secretion system protein ImpL n=1 Tax=Glaciimonas immobilis TaxID=728004 RepID=A0A840RQG3_9BURK|nr:type VI secretion system membrane subunit TssM [Glaciimonas immobilis]KAF3998079.1 type VI secretion system membrane subunit TssM [Glaciimonas immobilis]MBB5199228.1 type VI secretion system protein ImpL [Glaciimonas immobilis]
MSYLKRIFGFIFSSHTLALIALGLMAMVVWFLGPLLGFDGLYPMAGVASRVGLIVVLLSALLCWSLKLSASIVGVVALCLLIWHAGPLLSIGLVKPLATVWLRIIVIGSIAICYGAYWLYRLVQAMRLDENLLRKVFHPVQSKPATIARDEIRAVGSVVTKATQQLRKMRGIGGLSRLFEGKRYLYELPWYMVIGAPGTGKTTAIHNSGLEFPVAEQAVAQGWDGRSQTLNCDWWFTNDAVLIDTAGRYVEQSGPKDKGASDVNGAEWMGFLGQLLKYRPRAPINGALLVISAKDLISKRPDQRLALALAMRSRLTELRSQLGIRFPVYVMVTKMDILPGFSEYFHSMTAEWRAQIWGFTLPYRKDSEAAKSKDLHARCELELQLLEQRLNAGIDTRLQEEYDLGQRKKLYCLPEEFRSLSVLLKPMLEQIFMDSRYDNTQLGSTLRGVYFTSAAQLEQKIAADKDTLFQRFQRGLKGTAMPDEDSPVGSPNLSSTPDSINRRSFFLENLFRHVVIPEAHLVRPNLRWEARFRLMRVVGHLLAITLFVWLGSALVKSFGNNHHYLQAIKSKADNLESLVETYRKAPTNSAISTVLGAARDVANYKNLDLDNPGGAYRYGLFAAPVIVSGGNETYAQLRQQLLLPQIVKRIEVALNANIKAKKPEAIYDTLMVYLMLFDKEKFNEESIRRWVLHDWERYDSADALGGSNVMVPHLEAFLAERQQVPSSLKNESLIDAARAFLDGNPVISRLYKRATTAMEKDAPDNFTLLQAIGPQPTVILTLKSNSSLERGIPGLYTYQGYHDVFNERLPDLVGQALIEDNWVMGRRNIAKQAFRISSAGGPGRNDRIINDIRRQYLTDYGDYWHTFLDDIRTLSSSLEIDEGALALDVQALRILAAPDSPLVRLARVAVRETSLSEIALSDHDSITSRAMSALGKASGSARAVGSAANGHIASADVKLEKILVDNRFSALREVVTGQADTGSGPLLGATAGTNKALQLDAVMGLLNDQYTLLVIADNALTKNVVPQVSDIGTKLEAESERLPAPFRAVLSGIAGHATEKVGRGIKRLQIEELKAAVALLSTQIETSVSQACRVAIEGKYPFSASSLEVDIDDFSRIFANGGLIDEFFQKNLAPLVDTSIKPWRYKVINAAMPTVPGPDLIPFQRAAAIREVFFREPGGKRLSWKMDVKVASLDPQITQLLMDFDGQASVYSHGPIVPFRITWPGPRGGATAEITANPRVSPETSSVVTNGPWALFRLLGRGHIIDTASSNRLSVEFKFDGRRTVLDLQSGSLPNPLTGGLLKNFYCPKGVV